MGLFTSFFAPQCAIWPRVRQRRKRHVVAAFCGCCNGSSGSGVFSLLAAPLYQLSYPRPDESSSPSSSLLPTTWVLVVRSCFPLLENAREVLFRAAPCPGVGILSGLERSLGVAARFIGGRCDSRCCDLQLRWMLKSTDFHGLPPKVRKTTYLTFLVCFLFC